MNILWTGDVHIRLKDDVRYTTDLVAAIGFILEQCEKYKPELFIITGDLFDTKHPTTAEMALATKVFKRILDLGSEIVFLPGNHDNPANENLYHNLKPLQHLGIKGLHILEEAGLYSFKGKDFLVVPYIYQERAETLAKISALHDAYTGSELYFLGHFWADEYLDIVPPSSEFIVPMSYLRSLTKCKAVLLGHLHNGGLIEGNMWYCGSPYRTTWGDWAKDKMIWLLEDAKLTPLNTPTYPLQGLKFDQLTEADMNLTHTMIKLQADHLAVDQLADLHKVQKALEAKGNYVKVDLNLHGVKFGEVPTEENKAFTIDTFIDDYIKKNNLVSSQDLIKDVCNKIMTGAISADTHFSKVESLGLED